MLARDLKDVPCITGKMTTQQGDTANDELTGGKRQEWELGPSWLTLSTLYPWIWFSQTPSWVFWLLHHMAGVKNTALSVGNEDEMGKHSQSDWVEREDPACPSQLSARTQARSQTWEASSALWGLDSSDIPPTSLSDSRIHIWNTPLQRPFVRSFAPKPMRKRPSGRSIGHWEYPQGTLKNSSLYPST